MSSSRDKENSFTDKQMGSIHPISNMRDWILELLSEYGFTIIEGPEIETEKFNFDMLNIKKDHPARQMHDTFYVENKKYIKNSYITIPNWGMLESSPPIAISSGGKVYRKDDDSTHLPMFHQIEGILVDEVNFSNLKDLIYKIVHKIFGNKLLLI